MLLRRISDSTVAATCGTAHFMTRTLRRALHSGYQRWSLTIWRMRAGRSSDSASST